MKVKIVNKPFRKLAVGDELELRPAQAKIMVKLKRAVMVEDKPLGYQTRMMTAEPQESASAYVVVQEDASDPDVTPEAPYGYKVDGTPRKRPGRAAKAE